MLTAVWRGCARGNAIGKGKSNRIVGDCAAEFRDDCSYNETCVAKHKKHVA